MMSTLLFSVKSSISNTSYNTFSDSIQLSSCFDGIDKNVIPLDRSYVTYVFRTPWGSTTSIDVPKNATYEDFLILLLDKSWFVRNSLKIKQKSASIVATLSVGSPTNLVYVTYNGKIINRANYYSFQFHKRKEIFSEIRISVYLRLKGGMADRQNRVGSKFGGGGISSEQQAERERKERLRQLALETIDLARDPYLMRNHLGTYECKLCLTLHTNEGNYLAHTQGKKHQNGLAKRATMEAKHRGISNDGSESQNKESPPLTEAQLRVKYQNRLKIGRPGYEISKSRDPKTNQRCLSFTLFFPEIASNLQPRHRFMSCYEQKVESPPDRRYQYLLIAAEPYETVAFKIPNESIDDGEGRFISNWVEETKTFTLSFYFLHGERIYIKPEGKNVK